MAQTEPKQDSKQVVVELTMPLKDARQVLWTGRGAHEPMGQLWDNHGLDSKDLAWAIDCAFNSQVREAARTLLAYWMGQPVTLEKTLRYGPEVVEGSHYLEEQESNSMITIAILLGYGVGAAVTMILFALQQILSGQGWVGIVLGLIITLVIVSLMFWFNIKRAGEKYRTFRVGREGEEEIVERLRSALDNRWAIFRNLHLPGHDDDVDIVLVGPGGVWAVEAKSSHATLRAQGMKWEMQTRKGWGDVRINPSEQVNKDARQINEFLKKHGIVRWIERAIALASPQPVTNFELSEIPVWLLPTIEEKVGGLFTRYPPTEEETKKIVGIFKDLATKQIAKEDAESKK